MNPAVEEDRRFVLRATEAAIRIGLVAALVVACLKIVWPFLLPVTWGLIIAVAIQPPFEKIAKRLGGRRKTTATLLVLLALTLLLVPTWMFLGSVTDGVVDVAGKMIDGTLAMPAVPDGLAKLPMVGEKLEGGWESAAANLPAFVESHSSELAGIGAWILSSAAGLGLAALGCAFSIVIAGVMLATAAGGARAAESIGEQLAGARGVELVRLSAATVRSVAVGVVGVALIQSVLAALGFLVMGVPMAGVWALLVLVLAIAQLPPLLVMLPIIFYVFSTSGTVGSVLFTIWCLIVTASESVLKPLLLGRGVKVPMLVILIGALGGMLAMGILGLFIGAVVLAVGHQIWMAWALADEPA
jgi:Predicted permease